MPPIIDPRNSAVSLSVNFDDNFFFYDAELRKIAQVKIIDTSVNKTVEFKLRNDFN